MSWLWAELSSRWVDLHPFCNLNAVCLGQLLLSRCGCVVCVCVSVMLSRSSCNLHQIVHTKYYRSVVAHFIYTAYCHISKGEFWILWTQVTETHFATWRINWSIRVACQPMLSSCNCVSVCCSAMLFTGFSLNSLNTLSSGWVRVDSIDVWFCTVHDVTAVVDWWFIVCVL